MKSFYYYLYYIIGKFRKIYFMAIPDNKQEFKNSRVLFTIDAILTRVEATLISGVFITSLLATLKIPDSINGIISSFAVLACIAQPISVMWTSRLKKTKLFVCFTTILHQLLFSFTLFVPILNISHQSKILLFSLCFVLAHIFFQIGLPEKNNCIASLIHPKLRGKYFSISRSVSVATASIISLLSAIAMDYFKRNNQMLICFMIIGTIIFLLSIIDFFVLSNVKEPKVYLINENGSELHGTLLKKAKLKAKSIDKNKLYLEVLSIFSNKKTLKLLIVQFMWQFAFSLSYTYNTIYYIKELSLSYTYIMSVSLVTSLIGATVGKYWGKIADKYGMAKILKYAFMFYGIAQMILVLTVPQNGYVMFSISNLLFSIAWSFIDVGMLGIQLDYVISSKRVLVSSINASIGGASGFLASLLGGTILQIMQNVKPIIFGIHIYGQQILNALTLVVIFSIILYIKFVLQKLTKVSNDTDGVVTNRVS